MKLWMFLRSLEVLEEKMADAYGCFQARFRGDPATALFFATMKNEELGHRDIVRYERRLVFRGEEDFREIDWSDADVVETGRRADDTRDPASSRDLDEILRRCIALEESLAEIHYRTAVVAANPAIGEVITRLGSSDRAHIETLHRFAASRHPVETGKEATR
jgi:rubrerythrin